MYVRHGDDRGAGINAAPHVIELEGLRSEGLVYSEGRCLVCENL